MYYWQLSQQDDDVRRFHFDATAGQAPSLLWHNGKGDNGKGGWAVMPIPKKGLF